MSGHGVFGWSAGRGQGPEAVECACDHLGPGPVPGEAEKTAAAGGDEVGCGEQPQQHAFGLPSAGPTGEGEHGKPGAEIERDLDGLQQIRFCAVDFSGRLRRPLSRAARMRSSVRARWRCRNSRAATGRSRVLAAKQVIRMSSASVIRSGAPGGGVPCGRSVACLPPSRAGRRRPVRRPMPRRGSCRRLRGWPSRRRRGPAARPGGSPR